MKTKEREMKKAMSQQRAEQETGSTSVIEFWKSRCDTLETTKCPTEILEAHEARVAELKKMCLKYKEKADSLHSHATKERKSVQQLSEEVQTLQEQQETSQHFLSLYQLLSGIELAKKDDNTTICAVRNAGDSRAMVFSLNSVEDSYPEALEYKPIKIKASTAPNFMKDALEFPAYQAPLLTERIIDYVYAPPARP